MRRILIVAGCWIAGPLAAMAFLISTATRGPAEGCPYPQGCALQQAPAWQHIVFLLLACGPGLLATAHWLLARRRRPGER